MKQGPGDGVRSVLSQCRTCSAVMALGLTQGMALGWTSPAVAKLRTGEGPFVPSLHEATWIASVFDLGLVFGVAVSAGVFARLGRRQTVFVSPVSFSAWVLLTVLATDSWTLCAARLFAGAGHGVAMSFSYIYIGEVTTPKMRGALILTVTLLIPLGQLLAFTVGPFVSFLVQSLVPLPLIAVSFILILFCMEESPFYLATVGRYEDMELTLGRLRAGISAEDVRLEADTIARSMSEQHRDAASWTQTFSSPAARRATLLVLVVSGSLAALGVTTVLSFTQQIVEEAGATIKPEFCAVLLIAIKVSMVLAAMVLIERLGRRLQLCMGATLNFLAMGTLSAFFLARDVLKSDVTVVSWLPMVSLAVFVSASGVGVNAVPQVLMSELLPQRAKAIVAPLAISIVSVTSFAFNKSFLLLGATGGFHLPFGMYATANLLLAFFTFALVPETKGKTLVEVQELLSRRPAGMTAGKQTARETFQFKVETV